MQSYYVSVRGISSKSEVKDPHALATTGNLNGEGIITMKTVPY